MSKSLGESLPLLLSRSTSSTFSSSSSKYDYDPSPKALKPDLSIPPYSVSDAFAEVSVGLVNSLICIPVLMGFTNIVYSHEFFEPYRPTLVQLLLWASVLHQTCMTLFSSMNFAVCQVQDAGLLFLGAMATKITHSILTTPQCHDPTSTQCASAILSTTIFTIGLATSLLGLALIVIAKKQLARLINYIALSVISAYLAYIGALLLTAGVSISSTYSLQAPHDIAKLFYLHFPDALMAVPAWITAIALMFIVRRFQSGLTLPFCLVAIPVLFYSIAFSCGYSLQNLRDASLVAQPHSDTSDLFSHFHLGSIQPFQIPQIGVDWVLMVLVVAFSSALDIVSIELELGRPLDINGELLSIGFSNAINGVFLGSTGSYIFSQTIFTARCKPKSRLPGLTVIFVEGMVLLSSVDLSAYLPKIWFATTLSFIAFELIWEWLIERRKKVPVEDWRITVFTFAAIIFTNLQYGFFLGLLAALLHFVYTYSTTFSLGQSGFYESSNDVAVTVSPLVRSIIYHDEASHSTTSSPPSLESGLLIPPQVGIKIRSYLSKQVVILSIVGHLRFMTAPMLLDEVKSSLERLRKNRQPSQSARKGDTPVYMSITPDDDDDSDTDPRNCIDPFDGASYQLDFEQQQQQLEKQAYIDKFRQHRQLIAETSQTPTSYDSDDVNQQTGSISLNSLSPIAMSTPDIEHRFLNQNLELQLLPFHNSTLILDFTNVVGLDSSALHTIKLVLNSCNPPSEDELTPRLDVIFVGLSAETLDLFQRNGINVFRATHHQHNNQPQPQPFLSISAAATAAQPLQTSPIPISAIELSKQILNNSLLSNSNPIKENDQSLLEGSSIKYHQAQTEVASLFSIDPDTTPSFLPPYNPNTRSGGTILVHYDDLNDAKAWIAAKAFLIHTFNLPKP